MQAAQRVLLFLSAAMLCAAYGKPFYPESISNRSKDRISVSRKKESVSVRVVAYHEWDGQATLKSFPLEADREYEFSCRVVSPAIKSFYIQAFLIKGNRRIRIESEENSRLDERIVLRFNSLDFEKIEISLRNRCLEECVGGTFTVSDFFFGVVQKQTAVLPERLEVVPQFNSAGIYLNNNISSDPEKFRARLFFRRDGEAVFVPALPVSYDFNRKAMRASLVGLEENTGYTFKLEVDDSGKKRTFTGNFRTRSSNFPVAETIVLDKIPAEFKSGTSGGYIRYTSRPGVVLDGGNIGRAAINLENHR